MLTLSVIVAVMGLWLNSAAVVIGAMLLAPLMQPVLATGACLSMALFSKALWSFVKVILATVWCVLLAYILSRFLPDTELTSEIMARTQPDIKDLIVALAAGTAGAYATVRADASSSLPGVAVAVALVPPLAAAGIALEASKLTLATGALLLYGTNLAAIILASIFVFVTTGLVSTRRLLNNRLRMSIAVLAVAATVMLLSTQLYESFRQSIEQNQQQIQVEAVVDAWLGDSSLSRTVVFEDEAISVALRGGELPPDQSILQEELARDFPDSPIIVEWIRTQQATTTTTAPVAADQLRLERVTAAVEDWLANAEIDYQLDRVSIDDNTVRVNGAFAGDPPSIVDLTEALAEIDPALAPRLNWVELETIQPGDEVVTPLELNSESLATITADWARRRRLVVREFTFDGAALTVEVAGETPPSAISLRQLEEQALTVVDEVTVEVFYIERRPITTTTTTPTTSSNPETTTTTSG